MKIFALVIVILFLLVSCATKDQTTKPADFTGSASKEEHGSAADNTEDVFNPVKTQSSRVIFDISGTEPRFTKTAFSWSFDGNTANLPVSVEYHTLTPDKALLSNVVLNGDTVEFTPIKDQGTGTASITLHVGDYQKTVFIKVYDLSLRLAAIDYDDGPSEFTNQILDVLNDAGVSATFFVTGKAYHDVIHSYVGAEVYPEPLTKMAEWGHQIGNHTYEHPWQAMQDGVFPEGQTKEWMAYSEEEVKAQVMRLDSLIYDLAGIVPEYYSAPYGYAYVHADSVGKTLPIWMDSISPDDWRQETIKEQIVESILNVPANGIVIMHDVYQKTADAIREALESPQANKIQFVTFDELDEILQRNGKVSKLL